MNTYTYELTPVNGRKSFYGKALVIESDGMRFLISYTTLMAYYDKQGRLHRCDGYHSATTSTHIEAFCGLRWREFDKLEIEPKPNLEINVGF